MAQHIISTLKFLAFVLCIPLIIACATAFINELLLLDAAQTNCFFWGVISYVLCHAFIASPQALFQLGKRLVSDVFKFFQPLVMVAPLILPIFSIVLLIFMYFAPFLIPSVDLSSYFLFFASFTYAMHLFLTAQELREQDTLTLKPHYVFSMALVFFMSTLALSGMLSLCLSRFSFLQFLHTANLVAQDIYQAILQQLFALR